MKTFNYQGPLTSVTLADQTSVILFPGSTVSLPEDNEFVVTLMALDRLQSVKPAEEPAPTVKAPKSDG
jgi:hypothetical protein